MNSIFDNKTVLITGGTGSFGNKFVELLLSEHNPKAIRVYSRGELKQIEMERKFKSDKLRFLIGDVRDKDRIYRAMKGVDILVHAAALKHVPVCEYNPIEAIETNIRGAENVINAAIDTGVDRVIALSTDKAVQPVNLYGATKLVAEKLFVQANAYSGAKGPKFGCVRYGNVIGSSGSVIPLFKKQAETGELTLTDDKMTRFWITLESGANFVMRCASMLKGGEVFVPKIPATQIIDLADVIAPQAKKKVIGIRPGEKLHEVLITKEETAHTKEFDDYFVIEPEHPFWYELNLKGGKPLPQDFYYGSDVKSNWLNKDEIKKLLVSLKWM
ncbi:MAG: UDP-N-acetylglucosamine 4,6-dehydratase (inverting) [Candidatus Micrarchaeota archaeon]